MKPGNPNMPASMRMAFEDEQQAKEAIEYESNHTPDLEVLEYVRKN